MPEEKIATVFCWTHGGEEVNALVVMITVVIDVLILIMIVMYDTIVIMIVNNCCL